MGNTGSKFTSSSVKKRFNNRKKSSTIRSHQAKKAQRIVSLDILMEILSRLPVKSLSKVQLVCKEWQEIIHERYFIEKHMDRSTVDWNWYNITKPISCWHNPHEIESLSYIHGCDGLLLLKNNSSGKYSLWNPATRSVLELPDPHRYNYGFALSYVPSTRNYRIVAFYRDKETGVDSCEVLTPGFSKAWRRLAFPHINVNGYTKTENVSVVSTRGVVHCGLRLSNGKEIVHAIVSLDWDTERFTVNLFNSDDKTVWDLDWNGKLAFAVITRQTLEVMELEDYKKGRWCVKKKVIPLKFLEKYNYRLGNAVPLFAKNGDIWFWLKDEKIFIYTIETGEIADVKRSNYFLHENKLYIYKPSLITFEGMQPDTKLEGAQPFLMFD
ncbi:hypothetical protein CDL12_13118 [Handroanthus impetiginosus]|uniref:F-box domain-containing protein n=1 Tax=Handroanthus impetiginosus TaxID=429701 RepID=A0A2G9H9S5_9LAMI|nr:hypothetical protein CDL12_13118 [Handroanthus impetiginosus]